MELIYGTSNQAKLASMTKALKGMDVSLVGLGEFGREIPTALEDGKSPLENARMKAMTYYNYLKRPIFSCDSGLYFDNVPEELQPGVHVRNVNGKCLTDEEMIQYYSSLALKNGNLRARYKNAICCVVDEKHIYESMADSLSGDYFYIVDTPHERRVEGFPLNSLSVHISSGRYYFDITNREKENVKWNNGFRAFFQEVLTNCILNS